jgi:hypothetical protein
MDVTSISYSSLMMLLQIRVLDVFVAYRVVFSPSVPLTPRTLWLINPKTQKKILKCQDEPQIPIRLPF